MFGAFADAGVTEVLADDEHAREASAPKLRNSYSEKLSEVVVELEATGALWDALQKSLGMEGSEEVECLLSVPVEDMKTAVSSIKLAPEGKTEKVALSFIQKGRVHSLVKSVYSESCSFQCNHSLLHNFRFG